MVFSGFPQFSAVLLGNEGVGKSSLIARFYDDDVSKSVFVFAIGFVSFRVIRTQLILVVLVSTSRKADHFR